MGHVGVTNWRDTDLPKRVAKGRVEARRDDDQVRREFLDDRKEDLLAGEDVVFVSNNFFLVRLNVEWELNVEAPTCAFTDAFVFTDRTWVELPQVESMDRDVKHRRILPEDLGSAIADVHIPVEDADLLHVEFLLGNSSGNCHVVEEAETSN